MLPVLKLSGREVVAQVDGVRFEPATGQLLLDLIGREAIRFLGEHRRAEDLLDLIGAARRERETIEARAERCPLRKARAGTAFPP